MELSEVNDRINQFRRRLWTPVEVERWYGLDLICDATRQIVREAALAHFDGDTDLETLSPINHWNLQLYCTERALIPIRTAAMRLAMDVSTFQWVVDRLSDYQNFPALGNSGIASGFIRADYLHSFHMGFANLSNGGFGDRPDYIRKVHHQITEATGLRIKPQDCATSLKLNDAPIQPGFNIDFITQEPVALGYSINVDLPNGQGALRHVNTGFDVCSWKTFSMFHEMLQEWHPGHPERLTAQIRERLAHRTSDL